MRECIEAQPRLGNLIQEGVFNSRLWKCDVFIAFAEKGYGEDTGNPASTYFELERWANNRGNRSHPFLIDMREDGNQFLHVRAPLKGLLL